MHSIRAALTSGLPSISEHYQKTHQEKRKLQWEFFQSNNEMKMRAMVTELAKDVNAALTKTLDVFYNMYRSSSAGAIPLNSFYYLFQGVLGIDAMHIHKNRFI